jgi:cytochrome b561
VKGLEDIGKYFVGYTELSMAAKEMRSQLLQWVHLNTHWYILILYLFVLFLKVIAWLKRNERKTKCSQLLSIERIASDFLHLPYYSSRHYLPNEFWRSKNERTNEMKKFNMTLVMPILRNMLYWVSSLNRLSTSLNTNLDS